MMEWVMVGLLEKLKTSVPFPHRMLLRMLGEEEEEEDKLYIPPPLLAEFPLKVVLVMLGAEEEKLYNPPPLKLY